MKHFGFQLQDTDDVRGMNHQQYKACTHWLRFYARSVDKSINWEKVHERLLDAAIYGYSEINYADMLI